MSSDRYAARVAGFMFLFLIVIVGAVSVLFGGLEKDEISETLRNVADNDQRGNSRDDQQHDADLHAGLGVLFRSRSIPVALAALGLVASLILVVGVPLKTAGGRDTAEGAGIAIWIPMIVFEISTGLWLLIKGAKAPGQSAPSRYSLIDSRGNREREEVADVYRSVRASLPASAAKAPPNARRIHVVTRGREITCVRTAAAKAP